MKHYKSGDICLLSNRKTGEVGTLDIRRGCFGCELSKAPCYAAKMAHMTGIDFFYPVEMTLNEDRLQRQLQNYKPLWVRIGCNSEPSLDWEKTTRICELVKEAGKIPVVISKAHKDISSEQVARLAETNVRLQVSTSAFSKEAQDKRRNRLLVLAIAEGIPSSLRIVSGQFKEPTYTLKQEYHRLCAIAAKIPIIDTPLRIFKTSPLYKHLDSSAYKRHLSPLTGKLDNQQTAGLVIDGAYPCFSSCSREPRKEFSDPGCKHQCLTSL